MKLISTDELVTLIPYWPLFEIKLLNITVLFPLLTFIPLRPLYLIILSENSLSEELLANIPSPVLFIMLFSEISIFEELLINIPLRLFENVQSEIVTSLEPLIKIPLFPVDPFIIRLVIVELFPLIFIVKTGRLIFKACTVTFPLSG